MVRILILLMISLLIAIISAPFCAAQNQAQIDSQNKNQPLEIIIRDYAREQNFNGTVLIEAQSHKIYQESFGLADRTFDIPITNGTKFRIASITKMFTAVMILRLSEQGKLDLHASIKTYLTDYPGEGGERVTIHNLLNHTSGIENMDKIKSFDEAVINGIPSYQLPHTSLDMMKKYCSGRLVNEVGKVFDYNNADYIILGQIIEKITGKSYQQALKEIILTPLGMTETGLLYQHEIIKDLAATYWQLENTSRLINDLPVYTENWYAAGGLYSTTTDLMKFANALYGFKLIKPETLNLMLKPGLDDYGYGFWVANTEINGKKYQFTHRPGSIMGANTVLLHFLNEDLTIIILSNTNCTDIDRFAFKLAKIIIKDQQQYLNKDQRSEK